MNYRNANLLKVINDFANDDAPLKSSWNERALQRVVESAIRVENTLPLTVIGKNWSERYNGTDEIGIEDPITNAEIEFLWEAYKIGKKYYGEPVFDYFSVDEDRYEDVDFWRNFIKMGRETGPRAREKRLDQLQDYLVQSFSPITEPSREFKEWYQRTQIKGRVVGDYKPTLNVTFSVDQKNTNVGAPWFTRKNTKVDGVKAVDLAKHLADKWNVEELAHIVSFLGARAQRGKWSIRGSEKQAVEDYLLRVKDKKDFKRIGFTNYKARVIFAGPTAFTWKVSPLLKALIEQAKTWKGTNQVHLNGVEGIRLALTKLRKYVHDNLNDEYYPYNADATAYDTTVQPYHVQLLYDLTECMLPRFEDKKNYFWSLCALMARPLVYVEDMSNTLAQFRKNLKLVHKVRGLSSGEPFTNYGGSEIINVGIQWAQFKLNDRWSKMMTSAQQRGVSLVFTNGDDNLTIYKKGRDGTIKEYLHDVVDIMENDYKLKYQDPSSKGELGYFYGQYRLCNDDRFITPLTRMRIFWKEDNNSALPPYHYAITQMQALEYRWECKGVKEWVLKLIAPFDKYKLGTVDGRGVRITYDQFRRNLRTEAREFDKSSLEMVYKGDPTDTVRFDAGGEVNETWLRKQWDRIVDCLYSE